MQSTFPLQKNHSFEVNAEDAICALLSFDFILLGKEERDIIVKNHIKNLKELVCYLLKCDYMSVKIKQEILKFKLVN